MFPSSSSARPLAPLARLAATVALILLVLAACTGGGAGPSPSPSSPAAASASAVPAASPTQAAAFPAALTDDEGTAVTIPAEPQKIVSLTPATTEILFALGAGPRVVATDDASDVPAEAKALPDVATFSAVDTEQVVNLDADLVIAGGLGFTPADAIVRLRSLGIPVLVLYAASVEGVLKDIELIGDAVGSGVTARETTTAMRASMKAIADAAAGEAQKAGARPSVFYEIGYTDATGQIYAPADDSFLAEMVTLAGADAITTGDPNDYEIPLETLIERDPQVIVLGVNAYYAPTAEAVAARPGWNVMTAVKDGDIRPVQDLEVTRPGPRLPTGLRALVVAIWPDIQLPPAT